MTETADHRRDYLIRIGSALRYGTRTALDPVRTLGVNHPHRFALLSQSWTRCVDTAMTVHARYAEDRLSPLSACAAQVRDIALRGLAETWALLVDAYLADIDAEVAA